jgi:hypothetical protein
MSEILNEEYTRMVELLEIFGIGDELVKAS